METKDLVRMVKDKDPKAVAEIKLRLADGMKPPTPKQSEDK